jgi:hypothetical protein
MRRTLLGCVAVATCLVTVQACSTRPERVDRVVHIESYSISADEPKTVELYTVVGPSDRLKKASVVKETERTVTVKIVVNGSTGTGTPLGVPLTTDVVLKSPLERRRVIDAHTGKAVPLRKH